MEYQHDQTIQFLTHLSVTQGKFIDSTRLRVDAAASGSCEAGWLDASPVTLGCLYFHSTSMTYLQVNILFININIYLLTVQVNMLFAFVCIILFYTFQADKWCEDKGAHLIEIQTQVQKLHTA